MENKVQFSQVHAILNPIFIIDDDATYRERLSQAIRARGYEVTIVTDLEMLLNEGLPSTTGSALVDLRMPSVSGLDIVSALNQYNPLIRIVVVTGYGSIATAVEAMKRGAISYITKPATVTQMIEALNGNDSDGTKLDSASIPSLARFEWEHINSVLNRFNGNISKAAKQLGLHRRSLQRKLKGPPES